MDKMICGFGEETLVDYAGGVGNSEARATVERHLEACPACREFVAAQRALFAALASWEAPAVSAGFDRKLYDRLEAEAPWRERALRWIRPVWVRRSVPAFAAGLALAAAVFVVQRQGPAPVAVPSAKAAPSVVRKAVQMEPLRADQIEGALQDMESLQQFDGVMGSGDASEM